MLKGLTTVVFGAMLLTEQLFASLSLRCNQQQTLCEVRSTRLTIGDRVGVFSSENMLVAVGVVKELKGIQRMIEIQRRWGNIFRSHQARRIEDAAAENPDRFFRVQKPISKEMWGASLGLYSMGVGDVVVAYNFEGQYYRLLKDSIFLVGRLNYLTGSGNASDNLKSIPVQPVDISAIGLTGGIMKVFLPYNFIAFAAGGDIGFASVNAKIGGGYDVAQVLNDRIQPGTGLILRGHVAAVMKREGIQPRAGISFFRLQDSNSFGLFVGITKSL
ncbi:MAG: hypothetical protein ACOH5I_04015 [Oligoflexus sp.]